VTAGLWRNDNGAIGDWLGQANGGFAINAANSLTMVSSAWHVEPSPPAIV
jgi:hypothetical protein